MAEGAGSDDEVASRKHLQVDLELTAASTTPVPPYMHLHGPSEIELFAQRHCSDPAKAQQWVMDLVSQPSLLFSDHSCRSTMYYPMWAYVRPPGSVHGALPLTIHIFRNSVYPSEFACLLDQMQPPSSLEPCLRI